MNDDYPRPNVTADMLIPNENGEVLLIKRKNPPFQNAWAIPGGFIEVGQETIEQCAMREAKEETGLGIDIAYLIGVYSAPNRDPRGHTISAAFLATPITEKQAAEAIAGDDAGDVLWIDPRNTEFQSLELAFDHRIIIQDALKFF